MKTNRNAKTHEAALLVRLEDMEYSAAYLEECAVHGDMGDFLDAIRLIAKAREGGIKGVAEKTGINRVTLQRCLSPSGNPTVATLEKVLEVMGLRLSVARNERAPKRKRSRRSAARKSASV